MKTEKEYREAKSRLITQKNMMLELLDNQAFQLIMERMQSITDGAQESIITSIDWQDFIKRKAYLDGLLALSREIDTIIARGKNAEKIIKK